MSSINIIQRNEEKTLLGACFPPRLSDASGPIDAAITAASASTSSDRRALTTYSAPALAPPSPVQEIDRDDDGDHRIPPEPKPMSQEAKDRADAYNQMAVALHLQQKYEAALQVYQECLAMKKTIYGPHHPLVALTISNIGDLYMEQKKYRLAVERFRESYAIYKLVYGIQDETKRLQDRIAEAEKLELNADEALSCAII